VNPKARKKKSRKHPALPGGVMKFPQVKSKTLTEVEFSTTTEYHSIALRFHDKTELHFEIEPGFTLLAGYTDWKTGDSRPIRRWPVVRSRSLRL